MFDHKQAKVFCPECQELIEVDEGIAPLLSIIWDAGMITCNSCEENEPGIMWIEFFSMMDVEKFLLIQIDALGNRIHKHPDFNDWFCYRILGYEGNDLRPWRFDAHPNIYPVTPNQKSIYSRSSSNRRIELSVSVRFPREDYQIVLDLIKYYLARNSCTFEELSDDQWNYIKRYLPPQPIKGRKRSDDRRILNGILYVIQTGRSWRELPTRYGSYETAHRRLKQWSREGVLDTILGSIQDYDLNKDKLNIRLAGINSQQISSCKKGGTEYLTSIRKEMVDMAISK